MNSSVRALRSSANCPRCGAPPRIRTFPTVRKLEGQDPDEPVLTYQCHYQFKDGTRCNYIYKIRVKDFQVVA